MSNKHLIMTVADFSAIPADKIDACLADFADYLSIVRNGAELSEAAGNLLGLPAKSLSLNESCFLWIDDGIKGISGAQFSNEQGVVIGRIDLPRSAESAS